MILLIRQRTNMHAYSDCNVQDNPWFPSSSMCNACVAFGCQHITTVSIWCGFITCTFVLIKSFDLRSCFLTSMYSIVTDMKRYAYGRLNAVVPYKNGLNCYSDQSLETMVRFVELLLVLSSTITHWSLTMHKHYNVNNYSTFNRPFLVSLPLLTKFATHLQVLYNGHCIQ